MPQSNNLKPVYLLAGSQALLIERYIEDIKLSLAKEYPDYQLFTYHTESDSIEEIIGNANNYSIFGGKKLIIVKKCEKLKKEDISLIEKYIISPSIDCYMLFYSNESNKPKFKKHINLESKLFKSADQIEKRVIREGELLGVKLTPRAANEILNLIGDDLKSINNELLKISQYFINKEIIDEKDIQGFITKRSHEDIFQLINSITVKDRKSAISVLNELRSINYDPVSVVSTLSWRFRQIWHLKELLNSDITENDVSRELKVSSGALYYLKKQAGNFSFKSLSTTILLLSNLDKELKSYSQDKYNLISRFILQVCRI